MNETYEIKEDYVGFIFMALSFGYLISCQTVHFTGKFVQLRRACVIGFLINGAATVFYGPSQNLQIPHNLIISLISLFIGGLFSAYTLIPQIGEMITEAEI